ncbi:MAG: acyl-CoA thioesterase [Alphaproteobacteria bacterium]
MSAPSPGGALILTYRGVVYPSHLDHMGHMNVQFYVAKFDEAVWHLFDRIGVTPDYIRAHKRGMAAVEMNIRYLKELGAGDLVSVRSGLLRVGGRSIDLVQEMRLGEAGELAAVMKITAVHLDREAHRAVPFSEEIAARAREYLVDYPET